MQLINIYGVSVYCGLTFQWQVIVTLLCLSNRAVSIVIETAMYLHWIFLWYPSTLTVWPLKQASMPKKLVL